MAKRKKHIDPNAAREAAKYPHPIPSREFILSTLEKMDQPATCKELEKFLQLTTEEEHEALRRRLRAMERDGQLVSNRRGAYGPISKMNLVVGYVIGHRDGYGFVVPDDGSDDLFYLRIICEQYSMAIAYWYELQILIDKDVAKLHWLKFWNIKHHKSLDATWKKMAFHLSFLKINALARTSLFLAEARNTQNMGKL